MRTQLGTRTEVRGRRVIHLSPGTKVTHAEDPQAACGDACGDKGDFMWNTPTRPNFPNFQDVKLSGFDAEMYDFVRPGRANQKVWYGGFALLKTPCTAASSEGEVFF